MKTFRIFPGTLLLMGVLLACLGTLKTGAQTSWASAASANWNSAASWTPAIVPGVGTNAFITNSGTFTVTYNSLMAAPSIASLTLGLSGSSASIPTLTLTSGGFNVAGSCTTAGTSAEVINVNSGGVMNNGTLDLTAYNGLVNVNSGGAMTNGTTKVADNGSNDGNGALKIASGALANLGVLTVGRNNEGTGQGLLISGGTVSASSIDIGTRNSYSTMVVSGGTVTNAGNLRLGTGTATAGREVRYHQTGGTVGCAGTVDLPVASSYTTWFNVLGASATFSASGVRLYPGVVSSASARFTNSGSIYLGATGFNTLNSGTYSVSLNDQSILGATADWSGNVNITAPSGTTTFKSADINGVSHNITLTGVISGGANVAKTGGGLLNLNNANTYTGSTIVSAGSLILGNATALPKGTALTVGGSGTAGLVDLAGFNVQVSGLTSAGTAANQIITNSSTANTSTITFSNSAANSTFGGVIAGGSKPIALTLLGGNLTLSGQNTYAGNLLVNNGKLALSGAGSTFTGAAIVLSNSAAILDLTGMNNLALAAGQSLSGFGVVTGSVAAANCPITPGSNGNGGTLTISGNLTLNGNVTNQFDLLLDPNAAGNDLISVGGILNLSGVNLIKINPLAGSLFQGTYHLIQCASVGSGDTNNLQLSGSPGAGLQAALSVTATGVDLVVSPSGGAARLWVGDGSANSWDLTSSNWLNAGSPDTFTNGNFATFDDSSTNQTVNLVGALQPAAVTVNATANYIFQGSGKISGTVSFTKNNSGTLTLLTANDYNGVTTIAQGILQIGNGVTSGTLGSGALVDNGELLMQQPSSSTLSNTISGSGSLVQAGTATLTLAGSNTFNGGVAINSGTLQIGNGGTIGAGNVTNNAALIFNNSANNIVNDAISGSGSLTILGGGTIALNSNNTYSGSSTVSNGTLLVNNAIGTGTVTVAGNGQLGGSGTIGGAVTINSGGILIPGNPVGALTIASNLTMNSGSIMNFALGASNDRVAVSNNLSLTCTLNVTNSGVLGSGTFTLFTYGGSLLASSITLGSMPPGKLYVIDTTTPGQVNLIVGTIATNIPAFPGALGVGQNATGGRGGTIYHVTTLADSGTGSFRDAVSHSGRTIVFDVGGTITLSSVVSCSSGLTIAGQTAPGDGIAIIGHEVSFSAKQNEIVRFLRIRPGSLSASGEDAINVGDGTNMVFDHCSFEFAGYNNIDAHGNVGSDAITVQNSIIADPMSNGTAAKQGFGAHTEHVGGKMAWYYNLWVSEHNRQPMAKIDTIFVNNTLYNFQAGYTVADTSGHFRHDIINNYFITGPTDTSGGNAFYQMNANQTIYAIGNLRDNNNDGILNGGSIDPGGGYTPLTAPWSPLSTNTTVYTPAAAYRHDVSLVGPFPHDQLDNLILNQVKTLGNGSTGTGAGTAGPGGGLYFDQTSTGLGNNGYGIDNGGAAPLDSDGDGLPDFWEAAVGLDSNNPNDSTNLTLSGYTQLEIYLNWLAAPHVVANSNMVNVDLSPYAGGFTNVSPVYTVSAAINGGVTLLPDGHTAQFTTPGNFVGLASFNFVVAGSDGTRMTNTMGLAISSIAPPQDLVWRGDGSTNTWDTGTNANWFNGASLTTFNTGDTVTFDDTGSNIPAVNLVGTLKPSSLTVNAAQDYSLGGNGVLAGATLLIKSGAGTLTLATSNTFSGGTLLNGGKIVMANANANQFALGAGSVSLNDGTRLNLFDAGTGLPGAGDLPNSLAVSGSAILELPERGGVTGALTGSGTLNLIPHYVRADFNSDCSAFTGILNVSTPDSGGADFRMGSYAGFAGAVVTLSNNINAYFTGTINPSGGNTVDFGEIDAPASATLRGGPTAGRAVALRIGALGTDSGFAGTITEQTVGSTTSLIKIGGGTLTLGGANSYSGQTVVSNGTIVVNGSTGTNSFIVVNGILGGSGTIGGSAALYSGNAIMPGASTSPGTAGTLTIANGLALTNTALYFDFANNTTVGGGVNDLISLSGGALTLSGTSTVIPNYLNGALTSGTYTLINGGSSTTGSAANLAWGGASGTRQTVSFNTATPGTVLLNVSGSLPASLVWQGTNGNNWDLATINWLNGSTADKFFNVDSVLFNDTSTNGNVTIAAAVQPGSIVVSNNTLPYTFSGSSIAGNGSLIKNGVGTLAVNNSNNFSGGAFINSGTIVFASDLANSSGLGSGLITLNGGTLTMFNSPATTNNAAWNLSVPANATSTLNADSVCNLSGALSGGGTFNFNVPGTQTALQGDWSAFTGQINVAGGEFRVLNFAGYPAAAISLSNNVTADFQGIVDPNGTTLAIGELSSVSSSRLLGGPATNGEVLTWSIGGNNIDTTFAGQIGEQNTNANTAIEKVGSGKWTLTGSNSYNGGTLVSNGTLFVNNPSGSATGSGDVEVGDGATLGGIGAIAGSVSVDATATFAPGNPTGALSIGTDLNFDTAANLQVTLGSSSSTAAVAGDLSLAGNLSISAAPGFGVGTYILFTYSGALDFGGLAIVSAPAGYNYTINNATPGQVQLIVTRPQFNLVNLTGSNLVMGGSGGTSNGTYHILSSTNLTLQLNLWTPIATNQFDSNSNFSFTNAINPNTPRLFYILQSP